MCECVSVYMDECMGGVCVCVSVSVHAVVCDMLYCFESYHCFTWCCLCVHVCMRWKFALLCVCA